MYVGRRRKFELVREVLALCGYVGGRGGIPLTVQMQTGTRSGREIHSRPPLEGLAYPRQACHSGFIIDGESPRSETNLHNAYSSVVLYLAV